MIRRDFHNITHYKVVDNIFLLGIELVLYMNKFRWEETDGRYTVDG